MQLQQLEAIIKNLKQLQREQERLESELAACKKQVTQELNDRGVEELTVGSYKVRWTTVKTTHLDSKALKVALPELAQRFTVESSTKRLTIT